MPPVGANQVVHSSSSAPIAETAYQFNTVLAGSRSATFQAAADQEIPIGPPEGIEVRDFN